MSINQPNHSSKSLVDKLSQEVEDNLKNEQFGVEELAEKIGMSRSNLHRKLQDATGQSVSQFIREYRLKRAMGILQADDQITAVEVANEVGFGSATYFSKSFTDFYGYPPGEVRKRNLEQAENPEKSAPNSRNKVFLFIGGLILVTAILFFFNSQNLTSTEAVVAEEVEKSIAVLPFKNMSSDVDNQYFADGVMDAILNKLAKIGELKVTSRTSVQKYREVAMSIPEIAAELGVAYILEGSAQKYGDDVKIITQLIEASSDDHLWSEEYVSKFEDVLSLQGEIARKVADELHTVLTLNEKEELKKIPTKYPEAYDYYLLARFQYAKSTEENLKKAIDLYGSALKIDPDFAAAYVGLAEVYWVGGLSWGIFPENEAWSQIQQLLLKSLDLDATNADAYEMMANALFYYKWEFEQAREYYRKFKEISGLNGNVDFFIKMGLLDLAQETNEANIGLQPTSPFHYTFRAEINFHRNKVEEATRNLDEASELFDNHYFWREVAKLYYNFGELEKSRAAFERIKSNFPDRPPIFYWLEAIHNHNQGLDVTPSLSLMEEMFDNNSSGSPAWFLAMYYAATKDETKTFEWLEKSFERHEVEMTWLKMEPLLKPYKNDPRYQSIMDRMSFPD